MFLFSSVIVLLFILKYESSVSGIIANIIGWIALIIAIISLESSTLKLKDIQVDYWNVRGLELGKSRKYYDAVQAYDKASRLDPQSIKLLINKANDLCEKGKLLCDKDDEGPFIEALDTISHAILLGPKYPAKVRIGAEDESKAIQEYANALKTECDILLALADHREECGEPRISELRNCALKSAKKAINEYPENNPQLSGAYASKGNALLKLGNYNGAIEACVEAVEQDRYEAIIWAIKGSALASKGDHEAAIKDFDEAIKQKPDSSSFWYGKGQIIRNKGDRFKKDQIYGRAIEFFHIAIHAYNKAIEFDPLNKNAWNQKGRSLEELYLCNLSKDPTAHSSYVMLNERISRLTTDTTTYNKYNCYLIDALSSFNMAIDIDPSDVTFWFNKGRTLERLGRHSGAINAYDEAIRVDPDGAYYVWLHKGNVLMILRKYDEAIQAYDEAIRLNPEYVLAQYNKDVALRCKKEEWVSLTSW
jgi:tetratricopeptide (TPR) repeat protein